MFRVQYEGAEGEKLRVLALDGSVIHTQLLADALRRDQDFEVATLESASALTAAICKMDVDVLVLSANLEEKPLHGIEVLRGLRAVRPEIRAILLLDSSKPEVVLDAFRAGAKGVFTRMESIEKLRKCIRCVHNGQVWASSREMSVAIEALASAPMVHAVDAKGLNLLSRREMEIVESLAEGLTNREIAERLGLSQHTVKNHLFRIFDKVGVSSRVELLFMTLSQENNSQSVFDYMLKSSNNRFVEDNSKLAHVQQAANEGSPIAQLALAQFYWTRRADSRDLVESYRWCLVASQQISRASKGLSKSMTMEQLLQAERMAAESASRQQRPSFAAMAKAGAGSRTTEMATDC